MRRVALWAGLLPPATATQGQQAPGAEIEEIAPGIHVGIDSGNAEGSGPYLRPLDASIDVIEKVMSVLEDDDNSGFQNAAVNALDRVQVKHGPIPAVDAALRALKQRNAGRRETRARSGELFLTPDLDRDPW